MTSLTTNTSTNSISTVLSMPSAAISDQKNNGTKNYVTYSVAPCNWYRKPSVQMSAADWDCNMNELEFE